MTNRKTSNKPVRLIEGILDEYDERCALFEEFTSVIHRLILDLLKSNNLHVHSVTSRVKTKQSISAKIEKALDDTYQSLDDIHDICGIRIITYYPDEVDAVARVIQDEFNIDYSLSVDKRAILDPDRFGYLSLHYIAKLPDKRLRLTEYKPFKQCITEIQIRSILQHTWAEIEHDLGYKSKLAVPRDIRRRFSQLAGLLELADDTFVQIRDTLANYESTISDRINKTPDLVQIDQASLLTFVRQSETLLQIDNAISSSIDASLGKDITNDFVISQIPRLHYIDIKNIAELSEYLNTRKDDIVRIAATFLNKHNQIMKRPIKRLGRGVSILYLFFLLLIERSSDLTAFRQNLTSAGYSSSTLDSDAKLFEVLFYSYEQKQ